MRTSAHTVLGDLNYTKGKVSLLLSANFYQSSLMNTDHE